MISPHRRRSLTQTQMLPPSKGRWPAISPSIQPQTAQRMAETPACEMAAASPPTTPLKTSTGGRPRASFAQGDAAEAADSCQPSYPQANRENPRP